MIVEVVVKLQGDGVENPAYFKFAWDLKGGPLPHKDDTIVFGAFMFRVREVRHHVPITKKDLYIVLHAGLVAARGSRAVSAEDLCKEAEALPTVLVMDA